MYNLLAIVWSLLFSVHLGSAIIDITERAPHRWVNLALALVEFACVMALIKMGA